jgi:hypothetical protein
MQHHDKNASTDDERRIFYNQTVQIAIISSKVHISFKII